MRGGVWKNSSNVVCGGCSQLMSNGDGEHLVAGNRAASFRRALALASGSRGEASTRRATNLCSVKYSLIPAVATIVAGIDGGVSGG